MAAASMFGQSGSLRKIHYLPEVTKITCTSGRGSSTRHL